MLATFAGVPEPSLSHERTHLNAAPKHHDIPGILGAAEIKAAFAPWQSKVDDRMQKLGVK